jgi:sugar phosphate isomerase/epimerase
MNVVGSAIAITLLNLKPKDVNRLLCYRLRMKSESISRRSFVALAGALPLALAAQTGSRKVPIGIELYSVRDELAKDMPGTLRTVAIQGYEVVEFFNPYFTDWTPQTAKDARKVMDDSGIKCNSTHNNTPSFTADGLKKAIELNQIIGSRNIMMAQGPRITTLDGWKALGEQLTAVSEQLKPLGMGTGYHNHAQEWPLLEGKRPMDVLAASSSKDVTLQFDVGTCVQAGQDPVAWINANPGRIRSIHCKDWGAGQGRGYAVAFGEGDCPWLKIFEAAEKSGGVEYYLIEQEQSPQGQQFQMAEHCMANWKKLKT